MTEAGWLGALIPEEFGGSGLGILDACVILEEINRSGGNGAACHAQMYTMAAILNHGSEEQKRRYLPRIADGSLRLQAFGVTEPNAGSNTLKLKTFAEKVDGGYVVNGQKIWTSRYFQSHMYLLIARTTPLDQVQRKTDGLILRIRGAQVQAMASRACRAGDQHHCRAIVGPRHCRPYHGIGQGVSASRASRLVAHKCSSAEKSADRCRAERW